MGRSPSCEKLGLKKGPWTPEEDQKLLAFIDQHGHGSWGALPAKAGLLRCGKSCRLRWTNYLRPDIKRGKFSMQEEQTIIQLHALLGNRWSAIATHLPKRTDNEIKNYWNTHLKKRLSKMGIDPVTHKPCSGTLCATAGLSHMAQWESARLEAEARLVRESKLLTSIIHKNKHPLAPPPCLDVLNAWQAQLATLSSSSSCTTTEASAFSIIMGLAGGDNLESPTSTLSFHLGTFNFPATTTTNTVENDIVLHEDRMINIPTLPLSDMSYCNDTGNVAWFAGNEEDTEDDNIVNYAADGFPDFPVNAAQSYGVGTVHHGSGFVGEENKEYWNNVLTNLVTVNATSASATPPPSGTWPSGDVF